MLLPLLIPLFFVCTRISFCHFCILFVYLAFTQSIFCYVFSHNFAVLFSPFLDAYQLIHWYISIATFQRSRSNLSSTSLSSFLASS